MNPYDKERTAALWQRVRGEAPAETSARLILPLLALTRSLESLYGGLSQGDSRFRPFLGEVRRQTACLFGLYRLLTGGNPVLSKPAPGPKGGKTAWLSRCYGLEVRLFQGQAEAGLEPALSPTLGELAQETRRRCCQIPVFLGGK